MLVFVLVLCVPLLKFSVEGFVIEIIEPKIIEEFSKNDFNRTRMFSAMSPYHMEEECEPVRVWIITRHGSKYPAEEVLSDIEDKLIPDIQETVRDIYRIPGDDQKLVYEDLLTKNQKIIIRSIVKWKNNLDQGSHKDLTERGKQAMNEFGKRLKNKFWPLVKRLNKDNVEVISATEWRCVLSGKKFMNAFFIKDQDDIDIKRNAKDKRLKLVKPSSDEVEINDPDNPGNKILVEKLFFRQNCWKITKRINKILFPDYIEGYEGYREKLTDDMVLIMYNACAHGYYFLNDEGKKLDVWCWLFRFEDFQMFEDMQDLQYYYKNGYFLNKNIKLGNPLINDLLQFLENPTTIIFRLFVGHTSNCLSFITRFNLYRDNEVLTVYNIQRKTDRKWKTSSIAPFGCNVMVVVYNCGYTTFRVTIYINEVPIKIIFDDGLKCVKCPIKRVIDLIKSFNTDEVLESTSTEEKDKEKVMKKEKKADEKKKQKADDLQQKMKAELQQRLEETFDEDEEYYDKNEEQPTVV